MAISLMTVECEVDPEVVLDGLKPAEIVDYIGAQDLLVEISLSDMVDNAGAGELLDEIGEKEAIEHFGIEVAE